MKLKLAYILLIFCITSLQVVAQNPFLCEGQAYLSITPFANNSKIYEVVINTNGIAEFNEVGPGDTGQPLNALGYRSTDNFMYAINPNTNVLYQIDNTGTANFYADLALNPNYVYWGAAIHPDGSKMLFIGSIWGAGSQEMAFFDFDTQTITQQIPLTSTTTGTTPDILTTDIAYDPLSGEVYGYDRINRRLLIFDTANGEVLDNLFPAASIADGLGAMFFDSFGNLYGYDRQQGSDVANTLFRVNKNTGQVSVITTGPDTQGKDGCACPYTLKLQKTVTPEVTFPCTEVVYNFEISNASGTIQEGIYFEDYLPDGLTITEIVRNPFGGDIISGIGAEALIIDNMMIPPGIDNILIRVEVGENVIGMLQNQATISELPESLGEVSISDNPRTIIQDDSTTLLVEALFADLGADNAQICADEPIVLDVVNVADTPVSYAWNTGDTSATITVDQGGTYAVTVSTECEMVTDSIMVLASDVDVELGGIITIDLGDSISLFPTIRTVTPISNYQWTDPLGNTLSCLDCESPSARPFDDVTYTLEIRNQDGCIDTDSIQFRVLKDRNVFVPNAFSPNFDGINDTFFLQTKNQAQVNSFLIFDRWGNMVFERKNTVSNDATQGWDGTFRNKKMNPAVFVYIAEVEFLDGHVELLSGDVTLLRY